jgi:hypothetical protein
MTGSQPVGFGEGATEQSKNDLRVSDSVLQDYGVKLMMNL